MSVCSLLLELVLSVSDEVFHVTRLLADLGTVSDGIYDGFQSLAALVQFLAALYLVGFHAFYLGPRGSLITDAGIFFADLLFHYFHMLLGAWKLVHYLWTSKSRRLQEFIARWLMFVFHAAIVWVWCKGIQVTVRMHFVQVPVLIMPPPSPPPPPPPAQTPPPLVPLHLQPLPPGEPIPLLDISASTVPPPSRALLPLRNVRQPESASERTALFHRLNEPQQRREQED